MKFWMWYTLFSPVYFAAIAYEPKAFFPFVVVSFLAFMGFAFGDSHD